jgi:hypothetical protein
MDQGLAIGCTIRTLHTLYIEAYLGFLGQVYRYADMQASYATGDRDKVTAALEFPTFVPVPHIGYGGDMVD